MPHAAEILHMKLLRKQYCGLDYIRTIILLLDLIGYPKKQGYFSGSILAWFFPEDESSKGNGVRNGLGD